MEYYIHRDNRESSGGTMVQESEMQYGNVKVVSGEGQNGGNQYLSTDMKNLIGKSIEFTFDLNKSIKKYFTDKLIFRHKIENIDSSIDNIFISVIRKVSTFLYPKDMTVTITSSSLYFTMLCESGIRINYEVLYKRTSDDIQIFYTLYQNEERITSSFGNIDETIMELGQVLFPEDDYELPFKKLASVYPKIKNKEAYELELS